MATFRPGKPYRFLTLLTSYAPGSTAIVVFDSEADADGDFGPLSSLSQTEIAVAGLYCITLNLRRGAGTATPGTGAILINGLIVAADQADSSTGPRYLATAKLTQLDVGDLVEAQVSNWTTGTLVQDECHLELVRIGPVRWT